MRVWFPSKEYGLLLVYSSTALEKEARISVTAVVVTCYCFLVANPPVCLCFLPEHSLFPVLSRAARRILQKLLFPSLACNSRCAKGKLCEINCVSHSHWKPGLWKFIPRGPACPSLSSLLTQFPSLWSTSKIFYFFLELRIWEDAEAAVSGNITTGSAQKVPPATWPVCSALSGSPEHSRPTQRSGLSAQWLFLWPCQSRLSDKPTLPSSPLGLVAEESIMSLSSLHMLISGSIHIFWLSC